MFVIYDADGNIVQAMFGQEIIAAATAKAMGLQYLEITGCSQSDVDSFTATHIVVNGAIAEKPGE
uniref:hypothetical protein n=1 Tax=uncultured Sphingomonas sp. TaxID=158754 RepID=UPI0035C9DF1F